MANSEEDVENKLAELAKLKLEHEHLEQDYRHLAAFQDYILQRLDAVWVTRKDQEKQLSYLDTKYSVVCMLLLFSVSYTFFFVFFSLLCSQNFRRQARCTCVKLIYKIWICHVAKCSYILLFLECKQISMNIWKKCMVKSNQYFVKI